MNEIEALRAEIERNPYHQEAHYQLGKLYVEKQNIKLAKLRFLSVLDLNDRHIGAHFYTGLISLHEGQYQQAQWHFEAILSLNPHHVPALVNLGVLALKRDQGQMAIDYFTQALLFSPEHVEARKNLAATFLHYDRFENALTHYLELQKANHLETEDWYNMGVAAMSMGLTGDATQYFQHVLEVEPEHGASLSNLAAIYIREGRRGEAVPLLEKVLQQNPGDESSQFMLAVLQKQNQPLKPSPSYVKNLFDQYAVHFDLHLEKTLQYALPSQSFHCLRKLTQARFSRFLDLGCGTGLSGALWREYADHIVGVDLSGKMLAQAKKKQCYDVLVEEEILAFLKEEKASYDFIQALDVLPYFGEITELLSLVSARLSQQGIFMMSAEISDDAPWKIQESMRFCHHEDYLIQAAKKQGLILWQHERVVSRKENAKDLTIALIVFRQSSSL